MSRKSTFTSQDDKVIMNSIANERKLSFGLRRASNVLGKNINTIRNRYYAITIHSKRKASSVIPFTEVESKRLILFVKQSPGNITFAFRNAAKVMDRTEMALRVHYYRKLKNTVKPITVSSSIASYEGKNQLNPQTGPSVIYPGIDKLYDAVMNAYPKIELERLARLINTGDERLKFLLDSSKIK